MSEAGFTPATKRRWLRFSLGALFALMTIVAAALWVSKDWWATDPDEPVYIAATQPDDEATAKLIEATLQANGIVCECYSHDEWFSSIMYPQHNPADFVPGLARRTQEQAYKSYLACVYRRDSGRGRRAILASPPLSGRQIEVFSVDVPVQEQ